jgi:glycosyltransferase involved in cell wall biosynthesis
MRKLSVVIIAFNEVANIGACIDSVKEIVDDIVVVDSGSNDGTQELAENKGARVVYHAFEGHIEQKNWAITQAKYSFVLSLDADEKLSSELATSILKTKVENGEAYSMNRLNFYVGKAIKTCGLYPDRKLRLWESSKGKWTGTNPHDKFEVEKGVGIKHLEGDILHNTFPTHQDFLNQIEKFSSISAIQLKQKSVPVLFAKMLVNPVLRFIKIYFLKAGIIDGYTGWLICYHFSREVFLKYFKALKLKFDL